ncbi:hypothetical protein [Agrobacterium larrymoorei]|uniref:Uncharacterized protein n=1 Tax=Agrobacterium larrymoorei TaxID=160699 RepID=A0A4D7DXB4_9HYPH|nr:hypothetical protein [Agrobacterium larrymoorei]QCI98836.1 hypothetical protein CFBP5473_13590 [Agrobacterium larrymoorei]QYA08276.1 hypothetical protein J5285_06145 [Agrobacterium larrymoorei]
MTTATTTAASPITLPCPIIILGRDDKRKPHASFFPATDTRPAEKAAELMGMFALKVESDEIRSLLTRLPQGKLFDSGKAFVPFVKQDLYNEIAAHLSDEERERLEQPRAAPEPPPADVTHPVRPKSLPDSFDKIIVGSVVLATEGPLEGWYEAKVMEVKAEGSLRLQWRDYLDDPAFTRRIDQVAIIHPAYVEA